MEPILTNPANPSVGPGAVGSFNANQIPASATPNGGTINAQGVVTPPSTTPMAPILSNMPNGQDIGKGVIALGGNIENRQNTRDVMMGQGSTATPNGGTINAQGVVTPPPTPGIANTAPQTTAPTQTSSSPVITPEQRTSEITNHLNDGLKNSPYLFNDRSTFNQAYGYNQKPVNEQAVLDSFFNNHQKNTQATIDQTNIPISRENYLGAFISGNPPPESNSPSYIQAKNTYNRISPYLTQGPDAILGAVQSQKLTSDDLGNIQKYSPQVYNAYLQKKTQVDNMKNINNNSTILYNSMNGKSGKSVASSAVTNVNNAVAEVDNASNATLMNIGNTVTGGKNTGDVLLNKRIAIVQNNPDVISSYGTYTTANNAVRQDKIDQVTLMDQLRAQYPLLATNELNSVYNERMRAKAPQILSNQMALDTASANLNHFTQMASDNFDAYKTGFIQDQTLVNKQKELQMTADFNRNQIRVDLNDPVKSIQGMVDQYTKMGIPFNRSIQQIVSDFHTSGKDLPTYLSELQKNIQSKPEYNIAMNKVLGVSYEPKPMYGMNAYGQNVVIGYQTFNKATGKYENTNMGNNSSSMDSNTNYNTNSNYNSNSPMKRTDRNMNPTAFTTSVAKQAGLVEGVDYVQGDKFPDSNNYTAKLLGNPIETSIKVIDSIGFKTQAGQSRWTYTDALGLSNDSWKNMNHDQKVEAVKQMYHNEGGNGTAIGQSPQISQSTISSPTQNISQSSGNNQNTLTDAQINGIRGMLSKESTGMFNIKNEGPAAMVITGMQGPQALQKLHEMMSSYSQAPEYTTNEKKTIQNVINGDQPYEGAKDKQGYILTAIQDAAIKAKIEHWTPSDYKNANATKLAFSIGKYGEQIAAANTSIDHMMDYKTLLANNGNTQIPVVNEAWNRIKAAFGMEGPIDLNVLAGTVGDELAKTYNINTGGEKEAKAADFSSKLSPAQGAGAVNTQITMLAQRMKNINDAQWRPAKIMDATTGTIDNPQIQALLAKAGLLDPKFNSGTGTGTSTSTGVSQARFDRLTNYIINQ